MLSFPFRFQKPESPHLHFAAIWSIETKDTLVTRVRTLLSTSIVVPILVLFLAVTPVAQQPELVVQAGHSREVYSVAFSPDGKMLASGSYDQSVKLWDVATGRELRKFSGHTDNVTVVAFSADGKVLASGGADKKIKLWDVATGRELRTVTAHTDLVVSLAYSPDGKSFASAGYDSRIQLWDLATGQARTLTGHFSRVGSLAFSPDGKILASGGFDSSIKFWDVASGRDLGLTLWGHKYWILSVAFSPDGTMLASGSADETVKLWDLSKGREIHTLVGHSALVHSVAFSADSKMVLSAGGEAVIEYNKETAAPKPDNTIRVWDVGSGQQLSSLTGHARGVSSIDLSPDGKTLASGSADRTIKLWDLATGRELRTLGAHSGLVTRVAISADDKMIASGGWDKTIKLWDTTTGSALRPFTGHSDSVFALAFSRDGKTLASGCYDSQIKLWEIATGRELRTLKGHSGGVGSVTFSADGQTLASGSDDKTIGLWDLTTGKMRTLKGHTDGVNSVVFSPDGKVLASGSGDRTIKFWDVSKGRELLKIPGHSHWVTAVAFSPDGKTLASGSADSTIKLWKVDDGRPLLTLTGHSGAIFSLAFSSDGKTLISGGQDSLIKTWDVIGGQAVGTFTGHSGAILSVGFSANGKFVISGSLDATIKLWRRDNRELLASLISIDEGGWAIVTPDGRFDTNSVEEIPNLQWVFPDEPFRPLPPEIFMRQYYEPHLLPRLLASDDFKEVPPLADLNRVQPKVTITQVKKDGPDTAAVTVEVENGEHSYERNGNTIVQSGGKDLRLFRDGQLVSYRDGDLLGRQSGSGRCEPIAGNAKKCKAVFEHIRLPKQESVKDVEFSAYAFNSSDVKSETARYPFSYSREAPVRKGRAYLITVGVSSYENPAWNLEFAANDAHLIDETVSAKLRATGDYDEVVSVKLTSEERVVNGLVKTATKENFRNILRLLAGEKLNESEMKAVPNALKLEKATPEDVVLIFYSSHGYRDEERFYLFPYDIGQGTGRDPEAVVAQAISSDDLYRWLRDVDAGDLVLVIDACHAAAVTGKEFKPGPMGSRGMGQLAYDKGMRILAATQPDTTAAEVESIDQKLKIQHGLLTYALIQDGLLSLRADRNQDKVILLPEWLEYGVIGVPKLYEEVAKSQDSTGDQPTARGQQRGAGTVRFISRGDGDTSTQQPSLFDFTSKLRRKRQLVIQR